MLNPLTTTFISRLRQNDQAAWFELWETFGPVLRSQLNKWGKGRIGQETVKDLSQETMAALSNSINRYQPGRGARFSTWLLAIAKHILSDELDRRNAQKRGGVGSQYHSNHHAQSNPTLTTISLDQAWTDSSISRDLPVDQEYEAAIFRAKVEAAIKLVQKQSDFLDFSIYRMRVLDGKPGRDVADALNISEPTVSRRTARVRDALRARLHEIIATYSFSQDEIDEAQRNGLPLFSPIAHRSTNKTTATVPSQSDDMKFDEAVGEIYRLCAMQHPRA